MSYNSIMARGGKATPTRRGAAPRSHRRNGSQAEARPLRHLDHHSNPSSVCSIAEAGVVHLHVLGALLTLMVE